MCEPIRRLCRFTTQGCDWSESAWDWQHSAVRTNFPITTWEKRCVVHLSARQIKINFGRVVPVTESCLKDACRAKIRPELP
uniref:Uncharacterized protein n=1 Tax=Anguilla anguilla TaxID=7936 RepID=A0A0E9PVX2_ANGAN